MKKLPADAHALLQLLGRWRGEAAKARHQVRRIAVAFEAGQDGFWPARWLMANGVEVHVIHAASVAVSREHRTLKTPEGSPIPPNTLAELKRDFERQAFLKQQIRAVEAARLERLAKTPGEGSSAKVRLLARIVGIGVETADMLVQEVLSRNIRDRRGPLCGAHRLARRERRETARERSGPGG